MKLIDLVHAKAILAPLDATKRDASIGELMQVLVAAKVIKAAQSDDLVKAVLKRERKGSTGFGHGVAVPHAKTDLVDAPIAALGISPSGIDFSSLDRQPVHAVQRGHVVTVEEARGGDVGRDHAFLDQAVRVVARVLDQCTRSS